MIFSMESCDDCLLRILVLPNERVTVEDTMRGIRDRIAADSTARILGEESIKIAREDGHTLVKEETLGQPAKGPETAGRHVKTRYVTFNHAGDKYYFLLRSPSNRFPTDDLAFEGLLAKFRFGT